jgi:predicted permease
VDFRVLVFSLLLSIAASLLFGLAPLFHLEGENFDPSMRSGKRIVGGQGNRSRQALVAVQIAAAVVLLTATGLIGQSFLRLRDINPGFDPDNVLTAQLALPSARYPDSEAVSKFFDRAIAGASAIPGVRNAAIVSVLPMSGNFDRTSFEILGKTFPPGGMAGPDRYIVSPGYFATVSIPLRRGRLPTEQDDQNHQPVCVINETAARLWFAGESALGRKIRAGSATGAYDRSPFREVVGIVGDVAQYGLGLPATPQIYMPEKQFTVRYQTMLVRTASHPEAIASALRQTVIAIDAEQPLYDVATLEEIVSNTMATRRIGLWMLIGFALTALCLASLGVYGVVSYWVTQRTPEFGIRMVLGAQPAAILSMALRGGLRMIGVGLIAGAFGSLAVVRLIRAFLFEPSGADLPALVALGFVLALIAFAACYVPARRAAAVDPMVALRYE